MVVHRAPRHQHARHSRNYLSHLVQSEGFQQIQFTRSPHACASLITAGVIENVIKGEVAERFSAVVLPAKGRVRLRGQPEAGPSFGGKNMAVTYILYSAKTNKFYTGSSRTDAMSRLTAHNTGHTRSTKSGRPWVLILEESHANYTDAWQRENFLKSGAGRKWIGKNFGSLKS